MKFTVKELSQIAKITIKTLHHYHKIGLLIPQEVSDAGYRYYGPEELKRLQEILFYKELDFPLVEIKKLLDDSTNRTSTLEQQQTLFEKKIEKYQQLIYTLKVSLDYTKKGERMDNKLMFNGFETEEDWKNSLAEQNKHLKEEYHFEIDTTSVNVDEMNRLAVEAKNYLDGMAEFLRNRVKYDDTEVQAFVKEHLHFLKNNGHPITEEDYLNQTRFFLQDDFHRGMLEDQQIGLAYYLVLVAENL
ncbi:MerR family transcriptional regulator [Neobacillus sp. K501]